MGFVEVYTPTPWGRSGTDNFSSTRRPGPSRSNGASQHACRL